LDNRLGEPFDRALKIAQSSTIALIPAVNWISARDPGYVDCASEGRESLVDDRFKHLIARDGVSRFAN
jgi:hypothetical protein